MHFTYSEAGAEELSLAIATQLFTVGHVEVVYAEVEKTIIMQLHNSNAFWVGVHLITLVVAMVGSEAAGSDIIPHLGGMADRRRECVARLVGRVSVHLGRFYATGSAFNSAAAPAEDDGIPRLQIPEFES